MSSEHVLVVMDPGAMAGIALFIDGKLVCAKPAEGNTWRGLCEVLQPMVDGYQTSGGLCIIEDGFFGKFLKGSGTLYMRRGLCQAAAEASGISRFKFVQPSVWQNALLGKVPKGETKAYAKAYVQSRGHDLDSQDAIDAAAIGYWYLGNTYC